METPRKVGPVGRFIDWFAVWTALTGFIFVVAWEAFPSADPADAPGVLLRTVVVSTPIACGMWGVAWATRVSSTVPKRMADKLPYSQVGSDGTIGGTTTADARKKNPPVPPAGQGQ